MRLVFEPMFPNLKAAQKSALHFRKAEVSSFPKKRLAFSMNRTLFNQALLRTIIASISAQFLATIGEILEALFDGVSL